MRDSEVLVLRYVLGCIRWEVPMPTIVRAIEHICPDGTVSVRSILASLSRDAIDISGGTEPPLQVGDLLEHYFPEGRRLNSQQLEQVGDALHSVLGHEHYMRTVDDDRLPLKRRWIWPLWAVLVLIRLAADRTDRTVMAVCDELAKLNGVRPVSVVG